MQQLRPARVWLQLGLDQAGQFMRHVVSIDHFRMSGLEQTHALAQVRPMVADDLLRHTAALGQTLQAIVDVKAGAAGGYIQVQDGDLMMVQTVLAALEVLEEAPRTSRHLCWPMRRVQSRIHTQSERGGTKRRNKNRPQRSNQERTVWW